MNYLAHLYLANLTSKNPLALVGNLMGDFVKGEISAQYPSEIGAGIRLHRQIDSFTDGHRCIAATKTLFDPPLRRFAGIVLDLSFDHFLILHWSHFSNQKLERFTQYCYGALDAHYELLPSRLQWLLPRMKEVDLLGSYGSLEGLDRAFNHLANRLRRGEPLKQAAVFVDSNFTLLDDSFAVFFPELIAYVAGKGDKESQVARSAPMDKKVANRRSNPNSVRRR